MRTELPRFEVSLPKSSIFTLPDVSGIAIECEVGSVWVTLDGDQRDIVLERGERFVSPSHRRALVSALEPSRVAVSMPRPALSNSAPEPAPSRWRFWPHGLSPA
jgi:hypothetical protein